ncbi:ubiquitin fusion degradation protein I [Desarmillaria tabescens]|uniref:Ubiquitin fusion degradation protein I n=1 Tax=Armillaria tabescens TaxID=1929756 RepID=A0AA39NE71_ARMTA|nr:ubiquitin fusion degradation protein I [Desarmillaria tabescens]KAK0463974.1 ubiquitin fusion degradation protein I [Desarmillaria tabescens]
MNFNNPGQLFAQLAGGLPYAQPGHRPPSAYDEYLRAYSVAMLPGRERENVSYGGKIIMPPSALANLTNMDLESPWMFQLRNPTNPAASTHAGVLEFIAEEGVVHLPYWMMKTLRLNEGDPIRITGAELPKGKFVKLQAQTVHFLEISDPKAVLEQALRNFSALTQGDIIEICYNSIIFGLLVMETNPGGEGISVLDTDLEVDFAAPVGYIEPERPKAPPPSTMASKLQNRSRFCFPRFFAARVIIEWWICRFKGKGETLGGRKTKGRGISHRKIEEVAEGSKIIKSDKHRIVSNSTLDSDVKVPAALNLPFGKLFFGFNVTPYVPPVAPASSNSAADTSFTGSGQTLTGRGAGQSSASTSKGKEKATEESSASTSWSALGSGQTLGNQAPRELGTVGAGGARVPRIPRRNNATPQQQQKARSPSPDWGVDDDDVIMIDSD